MRFAPFALLALFALPACEPYGYGYGGTYGGQVYSPPPQAYGSPYYEQPVYAPPPSAGVLLFGGERDDRRRYDRGDQYRREDTRRDDYRRPADDRRDNRGERQRPQEQARPAQAAPPPRPGPGPQIQVRQGGHDPSYNPANPSSGDR